MAEEKEWTIMVYMAGDNNLSVDMAYALEQIKSAANNTSNINLFVYYDGLSNSIPTLYCDFSQHKTTEAIPVNYYRSNKIKDKLISVKGDGNENSASTASILNFVDWCVKKEGKNAEKKAATNYALIFSGHSLGFQSLGLFKDVKADDSMNLNDMKQMFERITLSAQQLEDAAKANPKSVEGGTTEIIGKKLALLGFDSCVMSMMEIGCQFKDITETMVASEGSIPNAGWSYAQLLLALPKTLTPKELAATFVYQFIRQQNKFSLAEISVDIAAWDFNALNGLETSFTMLVEKLLSCFNVADSVSYNQMRRLLLNVHWQCQTYMLEQNIDLGDFCQLLVKEIDLLKSEIDNQKIAEILKLSVRCNAVINDIRKCVILTGFSGGNYQFSNGVSLFFPWSLASYEAAKPDYEKLSFVQKNDAGKKWNKFLQKYLGEISRRHARKLTETDKDGNILAAGKDSVVYYSYQFMDDGITQTGSTQSGENSETRKPPDDPRNRMIDNLSLFLSVFKESKNTESFWNFSGFTGKVDFTPETTNSSGTATSSKFPIVPSPNRIMTFPIPRGTLINRIIDDFNAKVEEFTLPDDKLDSKALNKLSKTFSNQTIKQLEKTLDDPDLLDKFNKNTINAIKSLGGKIN
jgi:Clostripain family